jgi:hypothetical protein
MATYTERMAKRLIVLPIPLEFKEAVTRLLQVKPPPRAPRKRAAARKPRKQR